MRRARHHWMADQETGALLPSRMEGTAHLSHRLHELACRLVREAWEAEEAIPPPRIDLDRIKREALGPKHRERSRPRPEPLLVGVGGAEPPPYAQEPNFYRNIYRDRWLDDLAHAVLDGASPDDRDVEGAIRELVAQGRADDARRLIRCDAQRVDAWDVCTCCRKSRPVSVGTCGQRWCPHCHERYHRRKRRELARDFGRGCAAAWQIVVTLPPEERSKWPPESFPELAQLLWDRVVSRLLPPGVRVPAFAYFHPTGEGFKRCRETGDVEPFELPLVYHPHVNFLVGLRGLQECRSPSEVSTAPEWTRRRYKLREEYLGRNGLLGDWIADALGIRRHRVNFHVEPKVGGAELGHAFKYIIRSHGGGRASERVRWTQKYQRNLVPLGLLVQGWRAAWRVRLAELDGPGAPAAEVALLRDCGACKEGTRILSEDPEGTRVPDQAWMDRQRIDYQARASWYRNRVELLRAMLPGAQLVRALEDLQRKANDVVARLRPASWPWRHPPDDQEGQGAAPTPEPDHPTGAEREHP